MMRILFLGPLDSDHALQTRRAANPAAARWVRGLLEGLRNNGAEVVCLTHCSEQLWPKGEFLPGTEADFPLTTERVWCRYPNVYRLREWYLGRVYPRRIAKLARCHSFDAVLAYNVLYSANINGLRIANKVGIPCFPIILDGDNPLKDDWRWLLAGTNVADGIVFLSEWMMKNYPGGKPVFQLDGACRQWYGDRAMSESNLIVYVGGLDHWRGLDFLVNVVKNIRKADCRIVICGKCDRDAVRRAFGNDERVDVTGFLSDAQVHELCLRATVFLSTRDPGNADNILNFPSKIPNYLAYGKPVVSTWLPSLSPIYRRFLLVVDEEDPVCFANRVEEVLAWDPSMARQWGEDLKVWFCSNKLWDIQAARLLGWMHEIRGAQKQHVESCY